MAATLTTIDQVSGKAFDFIVIGGGTAGLVVAARLSEDASKSVLVLEAGGAHLDDPMTNLPGMFGKCLGNPEYDWEFTTVPQDHAEKTCHSWPRGKGLGGSSVANFYLFNRPGAEDINAWERLENPGWNWENFLKYSMKGEKFIPPPEDVSKEKRLTYDPKFHGTDGPLVLSFPKVHPGWDLPLQDTFEALGIKRIVEPQAGNRVGFSMDISTVNPFTNRRSSSVVYLKQAASRPNIKVLVNAPVSRILSAPGEGFVANGVEFTIEGQKHTVSTKEGGEIIVSAGAVKSPQILELSGIGDPRVLGPLGIDTKVDLPTVGTNVQDHPFATLSYELKEPEKFNTIEPLADPAVAAEQLKLLYRGEGLLTIGAVGMAMAPLGALSEYGAELEATSPVADRHIAGLVEQHAELIGRLEEGAANAEFVTFPGFWSMPNPPTPGSKNVTLCATLGRPFSRGTIHIDSTDPLAQPTIDPRVFEEEWDLRALIEEVKFARKVATTEPFASLLAREVNPGPAVQSDEDIALWIKKYLAIAAHTTSTCSMRPRDKGGVVDPQLRVYGTKNLRVVDLSVLPLIAASHTQSLVYAVAEQAADIIKGVFRA
ncbi:GMC oxidoreductase [Ganoderma leucocontextum]|nr:GMC oxidoreductase [Ganoderma leucocontextum]